MVCVVLDVLRANFCQIGHIFDINASIMSFKQSFFLGQNILQSDFRIKGNIFLGMTKIMWLNWIILVPILVHFWTKFNQNGWILWFSIKIKCRKAHLSYTITIGFVIDIAQNGAGQESIASILGYRILSFGGSYWRKMAKMVIFVICLELI